MKTVVLGITSGIAAFKMLDVVSLLKKEGVDVWTIVTQNAKKMLDVKELSKLSGHKVFSEVFDEQFSPENILKNRKVDHIDLADRADLFVVAPATANTIAKISHGIADDFLTTSVLATTARVLICPSMNSHMWANSIVQANVRALVQRGMSVLSPIKGPLACGYDGIGKLPSPEDIVKEITSELRTSKYLKGKRILVTAGATYEPIDDVRGITNRGSGKMGLAIADEAYKQGAIVTLLHAKTSPSSLYPYTHHEFTTAADLEKLIEQTIKDNDVIFHTAAVADYKMDHSIKGKTDSRTLLSLNLVPSEKIISKIKNWNPKVILVGFKAVYQLDEEEMVKKAKEKIEESNADFIAVNDIGRGDIGFGSDENEMVVVSKKLETTKLSKKPKHEIGTELLNLVIKE